jgi:hypothetical protein
MAIERNQPMNRILLTNVLLTAIAILLLLNLITGMIRPAYAASAIQYRVVPTHMIPATQAELEKILSPEGSNGWDLVMKYGTQTGDVLIFKR